MSALFHPYLCGRNAAEWLITMTEKIREQILAIRDSGETNMFDTRMVQYIANREGYYELVIYLEEHSKEYWHFIMTGSEE